MPKARRRKQGLRSPCHRCDTITLDDNHGAIYPGAAKTVIEELAARLARLVKLGHA
jgi:hypothetical protein